MTPSTRQPTLLDSRRGFLTVGGLATVGAVAAVAAAAPAAAEPIPTADSPRISVDVTEHGAVADSGHDSTAAFAAAIAAAARVRGRVVVPAGTYVVDTLTVPSFVKIQGLGADVSRYGAATSGGVNLKHARASEKPLLVIDGNGVTLENLGLQAGGSSAPLIRVVNGFESRFDRLQLSGVAGTALQVDRVNNNLWSDVFVNNSGTASAAAVVVKSPKVGTNSNTFTCVNLTIEGGPGPALDLAYGTSPDYFVEFVRLVGLHIEALQAGESPEGLVRIGNVRQVEFVSPIIYGGPGPLIVHDERAPRGIELWGGIRLIGGVLLGVDPAVVSGPSPVLIRLIKGDDFALLGTRLGRFSSAGVELGPSYGSRFVVDPATRIQNWGGSDVVRDKRPTRPEVTWNLRSAMEVDGTLTLGGHLVGIRPSGGEPRVEALAALGGPTTDPTVTGSDTAGHVFFAAGATPKAGAQVRITFAKAFDRKPVVVVTSLAQTGAAVFVQASKAHFDVCLPAALVGGGKAEFAYFVVG